MKNYNLLATVAAGIESVTAQELKQLGYQVQTENGRVRFTGNVQDIAKTNLWLRTADRIKIEFASFQAKTFEALYDLTYALPWEDILPLDANFPVSGKSVKSQLHSVPNCQKIVKKAIASRLMSYYHRRTNLPETGAVYPIEVSLVKDQVSLTLDTSGTSLFKRGYRVEKGAAPLKENMAAALVMLTTWYPDRPLYDPCCGSGTIAIEAALIGRNIAPGLKREFAAEHWTSLDPNDQVWQQARQEAKAQAKPDVMMDIEACDIDHRMVEIAKANAQEAGVADTISFKQMQLKDYRPKVDYGILIANPPYGDRMLTEDQVHTLYADMGKLYSQMPTWGKYILTSDEAFETYYGAKATKKRKLYNGALKVDYYQYWGERKPRQTNHDK